ncbi:MAG: sialate O-acetylesterase [archaeon]|nr:sialate O-acetylesterase [archaeon]
MKSFLFITLSLCLCSLIKSDPDPNFYIFLAFGQSNMEGRGDIEEVDKTVDERFQMMATCNFDAENRTEGNWYPAVPPLVRSNCRYIGPSDYFGRQLAEILPQSVRVGIINIAIGASSIDLFDEDKVEEYLKTCKESIRKTAQTYYHSNPFRHLMNKAKEAQKVGVIKGILLHQGEADCGEEDWPNNVKTVYDRMLKELNLTGDKCPLLAGEVVREEYGGTKAKHNAIIAKLPSVIPTSYVISADGLPPKDDHIHFNTISIRTFGRRYGVQMLRIITEDLHKARIPYYDRWLYLYEEMDLKKKLDKIDSQLYPH